MDNLLANDKIRLRPLEPDDIEHLYAWENNTEIWEVSNTLAPFSKYILAQYIRNSAEDIYTAKQLRLVIENNEGQAVGAIDLFDFDPYHQRAGVGILIHNTTDRHKGYASAALEVVKKYCQQHLGLHQLYANITADNHSSISLFEKQGFTQSGIKKEWIRTIDGRKDELFYQCML